MAKATPKKKATPKNPPKAKAASNARKAFEKARTRDAMLAGAAAATAAILVGARKPKREEALDRVSAKLRSRGISKAAIVEAVEKVEKMAAARGK